MIWMICARLAFTDKIAAFKFIRRFFQQKDRYEKEIAQRLRFANREIEGATPLVFEKFTGACRRQCGRAFTLDRIRQR
jgi:hypothetical protein